jgi:cation diffusion facilitator family transporter
MSDIEITTRVNRIRAAGWVGLVVNLALTAVKLVAGVAGHSQAVVADAIHSFTDIVTDIALIFGVRYWSAPADERHPHGHGRVETLVTVFIGLMVAAAAIGIAWDTLASIGKPSHPPSVIALAAAVLSIVVKEGLYRWTRKVGMEIGSSALVANAWHHRTDALSSVPVAVAVAVAMVDHSLAVVDRVGALVVAVFILHASFRIIRPALDQLVDAGAPSAHREELEQLALDVEGVRAAHALRTRYIGSELAVDLHVEIDGDLSVAESFEIVREVKRKFLKRGPDVADVIVQVEPHRDEEPDRD